MNFLSSALSSLTGTSIPYTFKEKVADNVGGVWTLHRGVNPKNQEEVLIFEYQVKENPRAEPLARNAFKKLKLIRFPQVVSVLDFIELDQGVHLITEPVTQLSSYLSTHELSEDAKVFGIHGIVAAVAFINAKCNCVHGNIGESLVFVTSLGDWKLLGFEICTNLTLDPDQPIYRNSSLLPQFLSLVPQNFDHDQLRQFPTKLDSYELGNWINQVFGGAQGVPKPLANATRKLCNALVTVRPTTEKFASETALFFDNNDIIGFNRELDELKFKQADEKLAFCKYNLSFLDTEDDVAARFPPGILGHKLVPELVSQYTNLTKFKHQGTPEEIAARQETINLLLNYIIRLGTKVDEAVFSKYIKPILFEAFLLPDRQVRLMLLNNLNDYQQHLLDSEVQQKIFTPLLLGFADTNFLIRETTLKSITIIIDKISQKQVNNELLRVLAKLQQDPKPLIRVNTLVLIIKISSKIYTNSKNSVLITALSKSLRDSFTPSKMMALSGFESLKLDFSLEEMCAKVLGQLAIALMDPKSSKVRKEAKRVFTLYLDEVEKHALTLPENEESEDQEEADFFSRITPNAGTQAASLALGAYSFGWSVVNMFVTEQNVKGLMNDDLKSLTPDLTRVSTPTPSQTVLTPTDGWGSAADDDDDDGWGATDDVAVEPTPKPTTTIKLGPRATKPLALKPLAKLTTKPSVRASTTTKPATSTSSLKLGTKKPIGLTLQLQVNDNDGDDDGWGNDDDGWGNGDDW